MRSKPLKMKLSAMLGFDARDNARKFALGERRKPATVTGEIRTWRKGSDGLLTLLTVDSVVIPPAGFALEKSAPLFFKLMRGGIGRKLLIKGGNLSLKIAVFFLKFRYFLFEQNKLVMKERVTLLQNDGGSVLGNKTLDLTDDGNAHNDKPDIK